MIICEMELCEAKYSSPGRQSSKAQASPGHCFSTPQMEGLKQPITQKEKLRLDWGREIPDALESVAVRRGGKGSCSSPPLARLLSSVWKENLNPALFVSSLLGICPGFHGNWLWTPERKVAPCSDCSDFPLPGPSLKLSDPPSLCPWEGLPPTVLRRLGQGTEEREASVHLSFPFHQAAAQSACSVP